MAPRTNPRLVLIVEDDKSIRESMVELLEGEGYPTTSAINGSDALSLLRDQQKDLPALIMLDVMMPVMDGWQFRREQTQDPALSGIPVVVVTADGNAQTKAQKMGAQGWIKKPLVIDAMLVEVAKFIS